MMKRKIKMMKLKKFLKKHLMEIYSKLLEITKQKRPLQLLKLEETQFMKKMDGILSFGPHVTAMKKL
jgi:hypothetical protein